MMKAEKNGYNEFIIARIEIALLRLRNNPAYMGRCRQQDKSEGKVERLLHKLNKDERITIRRHFEGQTVKQNFELNETYLQGMRDNIQILSFFNIFDKGGMFYK